MPGRLEEKLVNYRDYTLGLDCITVIESVPPLFTLTLVLAVGCLAVARGRSCRNG